MRQLHYYLVSMCKHVEHKSCCGSTCTVVANNATGVKQDRPQQGVDVTEKQLSRPEPCSATTSRVCSPVVIDLSQPKPARRPQRTCHTDR
mmetsp:Transcript_9176/g.14557  ORF Transcript_9176/g.14557 Transcript_9176/m.14557 type:complete len:90 (-) Transcript_9176:170-439(-)